MDVIVVGGGPAGVATAVHAARAGRWVVLCEARTFAQPALADLRTGEVLSPGAQQELARLGFSGAGAWRLDDFGLLRQFWTERRTSRTPLPAGLRYWQSDRGLFDRALLAFARANGVDVRLGARVGGVLRDAAGAVCGVALRDGEATLRAALVVDAAGRTSPIGTRLGLRATETAFQRFAVVCFFRYVPDTEAGAWEQHFLGGNTTLNGSRMRAGLFRFTLETDMHRRARFPHLHRPLDLFLALLAETRPALAARFRAADPLGYATAFAPVGYRVPQPVQPGLILVGDAAGYLDPATGQGIEFALRMARLAIAGDAAYEAGLRREVVRAQADLRLYLSATRQRWLLDTLGRLPPVRALVVRRLALPR